MSGSSSVVELHADPTALRAVGVNDNGHRHRSPSPTPQLPSAAAVTLSSPEWQQSPVHVSQTRQAGAASSASSSALGGRTSWSQAQHSARGVGGSDSSGADPNATYPDDDGVDGRGDVHRFDKRHARRGTGVAARAAVPSSESLTGGLFHAALVVGSTPAAASAFKYAAMQMLFRAVDAAGSGYVTLEQLQSWGRGAVATAARAPQLHQLVLERQAFVSALQR